MAAETEVVFSDIRRSFLAKDNDELMQCHEHVNGTISVTDLVEHLQAVAPEAALDDITINYATVSWVSPATDEERASRAARRARDKERHAEWERKTYQQLKDKFEPEEP